MIFNLYSRLAVKLGDEVHVFDRRRLMYSEVAEIEKVTGLSYGEWERELGRYSIGAVAALLHVLRKRDGQPSDYGSMQFNAAELDVVPVHEDGTEYTADEVAKDLTGRMDKAAGDANPPRAGAGATMTVPAEPALPTSQPATSPSSPNGSASAPGNGTASPTRTSSSARRTSTRS